MALSVVELPELLEAIASHLDSPDLISAACVCKTWSSVFTARIWSTIHVHHLSNPKFQERLPQNGHLMRSLMIVGAVNWPPLLEHCRLMEALDMTSTSLDIHVLEDIVQRFPRLRRLTLNGCLGQTLAWLQILQELEHLECLKFIDCGLEVIEDIVEVEGELSESEEQEQSDSEEDDDQDDSEYQYDPSDPFDDSYEQEMLPFDYLGDFLVARARTLTELSLRGSSLRGFKLWDDSSLQPTTLPVIALKRLSLAATSARICDVAVLLKQSTELEELDLSENFEPSWNNFPWRILGHTTKLAKLDLSQLCVDNDQLAQVLRDCKGIRSLIASQSNIQDVVLDTIVRMNALGDQRLEELDISWCPEISEARVARVLGVATLKSLKLSWCAKVESTIFGVPWACAQLEILEAQGLDSPKKKQRRIGYTENEHGRVEAEDKGDEEEEGPEEYDRIMFARLSSLTELRRLAVGSSTTIVSSSHGFGLLSSRLGKLQQLILVGDDVYPMGLEELRLVAQFPRLSSFEFSLGLVDGAGQTALAGMRPSLRQQEQEIYF
ncbi:hypothetical protein BG006_009290 [Podila minutissima]|uniref:F-box domain-containing protein n=1 Tax=Podila minutissima TaxID=64525 RepID=A0A9P5SQQ1_9FUNG|nr:hypothetical protein BG006_009290 [Podila minutissima]